jgi:TolB-like protein/Tfp pilus assembly protein PilF
VTGRTLSHYRLERRIGAGGMGEVFFARDLALDRPAAVKIPPPSLSPALRSRILREAEASARLQHPAIATFYEAGEASGVAFLAMEYVEGETLRERLRRGPLPVSEALPLAGCLLEALEHAHAAGVLHRDIKPENIMVTGAASAKLLDFGIARLFVSREEELDMPTATALSGDGGALGTVGFMSPEQLKGQPLDRRTDVFSLGAVLYEALTGAPAFPGETAAQRIAAILADEPLPLSGDPISPEIRSVLGRALARDPAKRYPSAAAFLADLRAVSTGEFVAELPDTLAVIDFQNLSRDPDDDWIGSGIAESLGADLSLLPGLTVVPRESVLRERGRAGAAGRAPDALELGRLLGCRWILSGGYQRMGRNLRIVSRLIAVATGESVANEKLDGTLDDIFRMQDQLAASTAGKLRPGRDAHAPRVQPRHVDAWEAHARGSRLFHRLEKGTMDQARGLFEEALRADPAYAPALASLAAVHAMRFPYQTDPGELEISADYARRAIAADPELAEPRIWLGYALFRQNRLEEGLAEERRAMELDPASVYAAYFAGVSLGLSGRFEDGLPFLQRAVSLDAAHGWAWLGLGWTHVELGRLSEGRWCLEKAVALEAGGSTGPTAGVAGYLGECLRRFGDLEAARSAALSGLEAAERSDGMYRDTFRAICLGTLGRIALDRSDPAAARAAFSQTVAQIRGRPRGLGCGQLLVQALAGHAAADESHSLFDEALGLFRDRRGYDFSTLWFCTDAESRAALGRAASALGRETEFPELNGIEPSNS